MRIRTKEIGGQNVVGQRIKAKREELGLSQKDFLAQLQIAGLDFSNSSLSKLEGQFRRVNDKELIVIAETLNVSFNWLLGLEE